MVVFQGYFALSMVINQGKNNFIWSKIKEITKGRRFVVLSGGVLFGGPSGGFWQSRARSVDSLRVRRDDLMLTRYHGESRFLLVRREHAFGLQSANVCNSLPDNRDKIVRSGVRNALFFRKERYQ